MGLRGVPFLWIFGRPYKTPALEPHGQTFKGLFVDFVGRQKSSKVFVESCFPCSSRVTREARKLSSDFEQFVDLGLVILVLDSCLIMVASFTETLQ